MVRGAPAPRPPVKPRTTETRGDMVNHPPHYNSHPSGIEQIEVTGHMNFCLGNAVKYIWRCDEKGKAIEDLKKAIFYLNWEIERRNGKSKEKSAREPECSKHQKSRRIIEYRKCLYPSEADNQERGLRNPEYHIQHDPSNEDNCRAGGEG